VSHSTCGLLSDALNQGGADVEQEHIRIVEGDPRIARSLVELARRFGDATLVPTAAAARQTVVKEHWGALVINQALLDGAGIDVLVSAREVHPRTPAVLLAANPSPQLVRAASELHAECVPGPPDLRRLARFLERALSRALDPSPPTLATLSHPASDAVREWARLYDLWASEADVFLKGVQGMTLEETARSRRKSPLTIKDQQRAVYQKTGDRSFKEAIARLRGEAGLGPLSGGAKNTAAPLLNAGPSSGERIARREGVRVRKNRTSRG
jgi:DNA-binding NarL/FixJ family response regulator